MSLQHLRLRQPLVLGDPPASSHRMPQLQRTKSQPVARSPGKPGRKYSTGKREMEGYCNGTWGKGVASNIQDRIDDANIPCKLLQAKWGSMGKASASASASQTSQTVARQRIPNIEAFVHLNSTPSRPSLLTFNGLLEGPDASMGPLYCNKECLGLRCLGLFPHASRKPWLSVPILSSNIALATLSPAKPPKTQLGNRSALNNTG